MTIIIKVSPVSFLKRLMRLFYLAWVDACTTGANRCMECARSQPLNMSRFILIKIIFTWKEEEEERDGKHQVTHASVRLWRTKHIFIWMAHRKSRPTTGDWRNWLNCIFLYAYIASVSRPTTTHALKLIAGGTGKLRLGFVSLCLWETRSRMNEGAAAPPQGFANWYENKEDRKMKRWPGCGLWAYYLPGYGLTCTYILAFT